MNMYWKNLSWKPETRACCQGKGESLILSHEKLREDILLIVECYVRVCLLMQSRAYMHKSWTCLLGGDSNFLVSGSNLSSSMVINHKISTTWASQFSVSLNKKLWILAGHATVYIIYFHELWYGWHYLVLSQVINLEIA